MRWRRQSTSTRIDCDLDEFEPEQLLQGLIDAKWITEEEASSIEARRSEKSPKPVLVGGFQSGDELDRAMVALRRHNRADALYYIERHLGREWMGLLQ
jgi:hypothetical protein